MLNEDLHPSDQDLLQLTDGELPTRRATQIRGHLAACWNCRRRMAEIEATILEFMQMHGETLDAQLPPIARPRAQLKARLAELTHGARPDRWMRLRFALNTRFVALVCALALLAVLGVRFLYRQIVRPESTAFAYAISLPNPSLTPGATTPVPMRDLCSMSHDDVVRAVPSTLQQTVLQEYGMRGASAANYEIDFLISPGLGGAQDLRNLWPEPRFNTVWSSFVKDQLEDYLHQSVCGGKLSLATAQQAIAGNWIAAYKKYFHTENPLTSDSTWGAPRVPSPLTYFRSAPSAGLFVDPRYIAFLPVGETGIAGGLPAPYWEQSALTAYLNDGGGSYFLRSRSGLRSDWQATRGSLLAWPATRERASDYACRISIGLAG